MKILKWGAAIAGMLAFLAIAAVTVGSLLPVAHQVSKSRTFSVSQTRLWDSTIAVFHRTNDGTYQILQADRPHRLVTGIVRKDLPFGGRWTYQFAGNDRQTTLTITEQGEIYNPLFRFMSRFVLGYYGSINGFLAALASDLRGTG